MGICIGYLDTVSDGRKGCWCCMRDAVLVGKIRCWLVRKGSDMWHVALVGKIRCWLVRNINS